MPKPNRRLSGETGSTPTTTTVNPEHSPREHVIEHIYERLRDADRSGDLYQEALDLLEWIEERTLGRDDEDGGLKFVNHDHPVGFLE